MFTLSIFEFEGQQVRTAGTWDKPMFAVVDVCKILGVSNPSAAVKKLDKDEKGLHFLKTLGGQQSVLFVTESGLLTLALRCRDAVTPGTVPHRFRKWVTQEVLPEIRKKGGYINPGATSEQLQELQARLVDLQYRLDQANKFILAGQEMADRTALVASIQTFVAKWRVRWRAGECPEAHHQWITMHANHILEMLGEHIFTVPIAQRTFTILSNFADRALIQNAIDSYDADQSYKSWLDQFLD